LFLGGRLDRLATGGEQEQPAREDEEGETVLMACASLEYVAKQSRRHRAFFSIMPPSDAGR